MQTRDKSSDPARTDGRPPFGLGPIARVRSVPPQPSAAAAQAQLRPGPASSVGPGARSARDAASPYRAGPAAVAGRATFAARGGTGFGLPNLRRNVCPHFYMTGSRGAIPIQAPHLLKALSRQETTVSRCQLRGGVHLEQSYVNDVCLSPRFNQCVFYEEDLADD